MNTTERDLTDDAPCKRCGAYCGDRDDCDLALDGVSPDQWRNPNAGQS